MNNKLSNIEKENLGKLLKVRLIRNLKNIDNKSFSQSLANISSQNISKFPNTSTNTDIINKVIKSYDNQEPKKINKNNSLSFKYLPKRLIKNKDNNTPHQILSHSMLLSPIITTHNSKINFEQNEKKHKIIKKILLSSKINFSSFEDFGEITNLKNVKNMKLRNEYNFKFGNIINNFKKFKKSSDLISHMNKNNYLEYNEKILEFFYNQSDLIFNSLFNLEQEGEKNIKMEINNFTKNLLITTEELNRHINKLINLLLNELNASVNNNIKISKINTNLEIKNNYTNSKLESLNKIMENPELNERILYIKEVENKLKKAKMKFTKKENDYIILINDLKGQIKNLNSLLDKNKEYYEKYKESCLLMEQNQKEKLEIKKHYRNEIKNIKIKDSLDKYDFNNLNEKLKESEKFIQIMKEKKLEYNKKEVGFRMKIKEMEKMISQKNENLLMLNEELNTYIYLFYSKNKNKKSDDLLIFDEN